MSKQSWAISIFSFVAFLGLLNAAYLTNVALSGDPLLCNFIKGCDIVATSPHSQIFGIPLSLLGVFFYFVLFALSLANIFKRGMVSAKIIFGISLLGFVLSLYFLYLQAFVIKAFCEYCLFSLFDSTLLFALSFFLMRKDSVAEEEVIINEE